MEIDITSIKVNKFKVLFKTSQSDYYDKNNPMIIKNKLKKYKVEPLRIHSNEVCSLYSLSKFYSWSNSLHYCVSRNYGLEDSSSTISLNYITNCYGGNDGSRIFTISRV